MMSFESKYVGCQAVIYSPDGKFLSRGAISSHDKDWDRVELSNGIPLELNINDECTLLILIKPEPWEYSVRVVKAGSKRAFVLLKGKPSENREIIRYQINFDAHIVALVREDNEYPLIVPLKVNVINISKSGLRLRADSNTLLKGDIFTLAINIEGKDRIVTAEVANHLDNNNVSEYGCRLLS